MSLSDRWKYSRFRPKNTATHTRYRNWLSSRYHARGNGKAPLPDRVTWGAASRMPVVRNRVNPATGRPRWTDRSPQALGRWRADRQDPARMRAVREAPLRVRIGDAREGRQADRAQARRTRETR